MTQRDCKEEPDVRHYKAYLKRAEWLELNVVCEYNRLFSAFLAARDARDATTTATAARTSKK